jgi:nucleoside-diphosphate kinase
VAANETTLVLIKPDAVARRLIGEVLGRFEQRGFRIRALKQLVLEEAVAERHYEEHVGKPFFGELVEFITSGPLVAMALEGPNAVATVRTMMGATNPLDSAPGTIRGDLALELSENIVHGSDSPESAARELPLYFAAGELLPAGE